MTGKLRIARNSLLGIIALIVVFGIGGIVYSLAMDQLDYKEVASKPLAAPKKVQEPSIKPAQPAPNAIVGVALGSLTSPVPPGSNATMTVRTTPGVKCLISVTYNGAASTDSGLSPKTADAYGTASWTWTIPAAVPVGSWPVKVTCNNQAHSAVYETNIQVAK